MKFDLKEGEEQESDDNKNDTCHDSDDNSDNQDSGECIRISKYLNNWILLEKFIAYLSNHLLLKFSWIFFFADVLEIDSGAEDLDVMLDNKSKKMKLTARNVKSLIRVSIYTVINRQLLSDILEKLAINDWRSTVSNIGCSY